MRKKRLIRTVIVVVCIAILFFIAAILWMKKDAEEYAKWQAQYKGVWLSPDGQYKMTVRRVTSAHIIFSVTNKQSGLALEYASAAATGDGEYSFPFKLSRGMDGSVSAGYGNMANGTILLKEKALSLEIPTLEKFEDGLQFHGALKRKSALNNIKRTDLQKFMGKDKPGDYSKDKNSYVVEEEKGKINRVHINWDAHPSRAGYESYEISGINPICMVSDLQSRFGDPIEEKQLPDNRYKRVYEKDGYRYQFITEAYGLVVEGDCQYQKPNRGRREGDFIMEGDTVIRYLGDYEKSESISLPKGTKRIASGAFTVTPDIVLLNNVKTIKLSIPQGIQIERDAFRECSRMLITLEEGWTSVPEGAFAHMVEKERVKGKDGWIKVNLPHSLRRLEKEAFETIWWSTERDGWDLDDEDGLVWSDEVATQPVTVLLNEELEYIGDNALYGIANTMFPKMLKYIGTNFLMMSSTSYWEGSEVRAEMPDGMDDWDYCYNVTLPEQIEYVADNGLSFWSPGCGLYNISNGVILHIPKNCKYVPYLPYFQIEEYSVDESNSMYCSKDGWLFSKDGKTLYKTTGLIDYKENQKGRDVKFPYKKRTNSSVRDIEEGDPIPTYVYIEEGVEEIAEYALAIPIIYRMRYGCELQYITPKSLKCMDRTALFMRDYRDDTQGDYTVKVAGEVPRFTGEFPADCKFKQKIYVKRHLREKFIKALTKGQNMTRNQKTQLASCIVGY